MSLDNIDSVNIQQATVELKRAQEKLASEISEYNRLVPGVDNYEELARQAASELRDAESQLKYAENQVKRAQEEYSEEVVEEQEKTTVLSVNPGDIFLARGVNRIIFGKPEGHYAFYAEDSTTTIEINGADMVEPEATMTVEAHEGVKTIIEVDDNAAEAFRERFELVDSREGLVLVAAEGEGPELRIAHGASLLIRDRETGELMDVSLLYFEDRLDQTPVRNGGDVADGSAVHPTQHAGMKLIDSFIEHLEKQRKNV